MKRIVILTLVAASLCLVSCDAFRKLAGRPTSDDLEAIMEESLRQKDQEMKDSIAKIEQAYADSLAILDSLRQLGGTILNGSSMGGLFTTKLDYRYYVVVGAFKQRSLAEKLLVRVNEEDYVGTIISFRNGFNAVAICPSQNLGNAFESLGKVRDEEFCPDDVWILVNE